jgi:hypothetical protein
LCPIGIHKIAERTMASEFQAVLNLLMQYKPANEQGMTK